MGKVKIIKEDYISFTVLKLAKEVGIDFWQERMGSLMNMSSSLHKNTYYCYPTQALLQRFLRERRDINVCVNPYSVMGWGYVFHSQDKIKKHKGIGFKTYEDALDEGLEQALEMLKKQYSDDSKT